VVLPAVELHDHASLRPREVDLHSLNEDVGLGRRETAVIEEGGEASLEVSLGMGRGRERAEGFGAALRRVPVWLRALEPQALRLVNGLLQLVFLQDAGEVELCAGGGGDGDAVAGGDLVGGENGSVKEESGSLGLVPRHGDLDAAVEGPQAPKRSGRSMAEDTAGRKGRCHPPPPQRDHLVAHGVHPAVKRVEPARPEPKVDRPGADVRRDQLRTCDDAMLPPREGRDHRVRAKVANFAPYTVVNFATLAHAPNRDAKNATELTPSMPIFEHHSPKTLITNRLSRPPSNSA
jgi:hypothetical protein